MNREPELKIIRRAYARQITAAGGVSDPRVEGAFAVVAREDFLGPGPWQIVRWGGGYRATPEAHTDRPPPWREDHGATSRCQSVIRAVLEE